MDYEDVVARAAAQLATRLPVTAHQLERGFLEGSRYGATPVARGAALPHQQLPGLREAALVLVRCRSGLCIQLDGPDEAPSDPVYAFFFLISPEDHPGDHLRTLASIASRLDEESFMDEWKAAETEQQLKETLLHHDRYLSLYLRPDEATADFIGQPLRELDLPANTLVALVHRGGTVTIPRGSTVLREGDRITVIGEAASIRRLYDTYRGEDAAS